MSTENTQTKPAATPAAAAGKPASAPAAEKAAKPKAEPKPPRFAPTGTIKLLKDEKSGKSFGPGKDDTTINPKRKDSKSHTWFANYKDGMTIAELQEAYKKTGGSMNSNLDWDIKHKYVEYVAPKAA